MKYTIKSVTRTQEGASLEDILNGDAYETAYIVTNEDGDIVRDTTNFAEVIPYMVKETAIHQHEQDITNIAENYGTLDILTAYLMRSRGMSYEEANDMVLTLDAELDSMLEDNEEEEYIPSSTNGDYSPSNPWNAPGMSPSMFI